MVEMLAITLQNRPDKDGTYGGRNIMTGGVLDNRHLQRALRDRDPEVV